MLKIFSHQTVPCNVWDTKENPFLCQPKKKPQNQPKNKELGRTGCGAQRPDKQTKSNSMSITFG